MDHTTQAPQGQPDPQELSPIQLTWIGQENYQAFSAYIPVSLQALALSGSGLGAIDSDGVACGALVFSIEEACCILHSIFVHPAYRRTYIASTLVGELIEGVEATVEWGVQSIQADFDQSPLSGLLPFFQTLGFQLEQQGGQSCVIQLRDLVGLSSFEQISTAIDALPVCSFDQFSDYELKQITKVLDRNEVLFLPEGLSPQSMSPELSFALYHKDQLYACACLTPMGETQLVLSQFYVNKKSPAAGVAVLQDMARKVLATYPPETTVEIPLLTASAARLTNHFLPTELCTMQYAYRATWQF